MEVWELMADAHDGQKGANVKTIWRRLRLWLEYFRAYSVNEETTCIPAQKGIIEGTARHKNLKIYATGTVGGDSDPQVRHGE